jgi:hypothetical protein
MHQCLSRGGADRFECGWAPTEWNGHWGKQFVFVVSFVFVYDLPSIRHSECVKHGGRGSQNKTASATGSAAGSTSTGAASPLKIRLGGVVSVGIAALLLSS